ncbi:EF-hand calcium-binding domain-containing protein 11 isoform X2 [Papio anubis]|uniref:EF-hand calcium-binding domain-containing protein 11 isoform X2 n=1 Tax=Papio anubis TaxID=9555 RepID=UPI00083EE738|nr:EF-hand calcium-binding domain-containing protein 11 isoform X2 [Papio anubis]
MFFSEARARSRTWEASPSEHRMWVEVFKACDEDHKGYLSREDFKIAVVMLFGYKPSKIEVDSVMSSVNPNTSGILLEGFLNIVRKKKEAQRYRNEVRHIFTAFDTYYRGFLTLEDFKKAFRQVAPKLPERTVLEVFRLLGAPSVRDYIKTDPQIEVSVLTQATGKLSCSPLDFTLMWESYPVRRSKLGKSCIFTSDLVPT